ncbi:hypothetical protein [Accumulibacter sp.]|uniref:hypothetical protein n=1 Tax=Accumulibacter sp. TaxID=2053492 RepID=UPI0025F0A383|nr:hypothetical protein [Accumulibacter sp.]MCP5228390.1 hypothetical protein [Accumulibacter sp.]
MSIALRSLAVFPLAALLTACGGVDWQAPPRVDTAEVDRGFTQSPDPTVNIEPVKAIALVGATGYAASHYTGPAANLGLAAAAAVVAYVVYDPLAPNWTIEEWVVDGDTYRLSMRAKGFRTGGDGESGLILNRRARQLQRKRGYLGYRILDYSEGIESSTPITHRYAEGTFQLVHSVSDGAH